MMNELSDGRIIASYHSWCHHLYSVTPPKTGIEGAAQELAKIFFRLPACAPPQYSSEEWDAKLQEELKLMDRQAKATCDWYYQQPSVSVEMTKLRSLLEPALMDHPTPVQRTIRPNPSYEASFEARHLEGTSESDGPHASAHDLIGLSPESPVTVFKSKNLSGLTKDAKTMPNVEKLQTIAITSHSEDAKPVEQAPASSRSRALPPHLRKKNPDHARKQTDISSQKIAHAESCYDLERRMRKQLEETCDDHLNNDCAWTDSKPCRNKACTHPHICKTWWLGVKAGNLNACQHGGEGASHYEDGAKFNHIRPNCQILFAKKPKPCSRPDGKPCFFGHNHEDLRAVRAKKPQR